LDLKRTVKRLFTALVDGTSFTVPEHDARVSLLRERQDRVTCSCNGAPVHEQEISLWIGRATPANKKGRDQHGRGPCCLGQITTPREC